MQDSSNTSNAMNLAAPPKTDNTERAVHIIHVPVEIILGEMRLSALSEGPVGTVTLKQVEKHIGQPAARDIVVFNKQPWHFAGPSGQLQLRSHPQVHIDFPDSVVVLSIGGNQKAVWWSETSFTITSVRPSPHHPNPHFPEAATTPPQYPFTDSLVTRVENHNGRDLFVVRSSVPVPGAANHMYKIVFTIGGDPIDPDAYCTP